MTEDDTMSRDERKVAAIIWEVSRKEESLPDIEQDMNGEGTFKTGPVTVRNFDETHHGDDTEFMSQRTRFISELDGKGAEWHDVMGSETCECCGEEQSTDTDGVVVEELLDWATNFDDYPTWRAVEGLNRVGFVREETDDFEWRTIWAVDSEVDEVDDIKEDQHWYSFADGFVWKIIGTDDTYALVEDVTANRHNELIEKGELLEWEDLAPIDYYDKIERHENEKRREEMQELREQVESDRPDYFEELASEASMFEMRADAFDEIHRLAEEIDCNWGGCNPTVEGYDRIHISGTVSDMAQPVKDLLNHKYARRHSVDYDIENDWFKFDVTFEIA